MTHPTLRDRLRARDLRQAARVLLAGTAMVLAQPALAAQDLVVFEWAGYEDPQFHQAYVEKHGASPTFAFFGDEEEAFQKLRAGFAADLSHPCSQSVAKWRDAGLLEPFDTSRITAWADIDPALANMAGFSENGQQYLIPFDWGNTALLYNTEQVPAEEAQSLHVLADPKYQGKVSIPDNVDDAYALGFLAVGVTDWTTATDEQFQAASDFLRKVHQNIRTYWADGAELGQLMASGEVVASWSWNEAALQLIREGHPAAYKKDTKEGHSTWVCGLAKIANGEASDDLLYDYINAVLEPRTTKHLVEVWSYGHSNMTAMASLDQAMLQEKGFASGVSEFKAETLFQSPLPIELREKMIAEFEKIKAGF